MASSDPSRESDIAAELKAAKTRLIWFRATDAVHQGAAFLVCGTTLAALLVARRFVALNLMDWVWTMAGAMFFGVPSLWIVAAIAGWLVKPTRQQLDLLAAESRRIQRG